MAVLTSSSVLPFFEYLQFEKRYSAHTLAAYRSDIGDFLAYLEKNYGAMPIREIQHHFIRSWLAGMKDKGLSARSLNRKISSLKSLFKYMLRTGAIGSNPMSKIIVPKTPKRLPVFVKEEDTENLLDTLEAHAEDWKSLNTRMLITILYSTGMRLNELLNLSDQQVDAGRQQIKVLGKGNKERIIPVSAGLVKLIRDYQQEKRKKFGEEAGTLLVTEKGKKLYPKYAWLLVNRALGQATTLDKKSPHVLRHSFATHLMNQGASLNAVKELLGHSSLAATQVYTHNTIEKLKDVHKKAHPRG